MMTSRYFAHLRVFFTRSEMKVDFRLPFTIIHKKLFSSVYAISPRISSYPLRRHKEPFHPGYPNWFSISGTAHSTFVDSEKTLDLEQEQDKHSDGEVIESADVLSDEFVEELSGGDPEIKNKIKIIELEYELLKQSGKEVPSYITAKKWKELISLNSRNQRIKYFHYLFITERRIMNEKAKKEENKKKREQSKESEGEECQKYSLFQSSLLQRISVKHENAFHNNALMQAMKFGQPLIFDCSYCDYMNKKDSSNCAEQLQISYGSNRMHQQPFNLYLCNISRESELMKSLHKFMPPLYEAYFPLNITEQSYLDLFPKEQLVYLTPNCSEVMEVFEQDAIYIIGALVDKTVQEPLSLAKAKREGLKMKKLPLEKYLNWGIGNKSLTLDQMLNILLEIHFTHNWEKALRFVPKRKLKSHQSFQEQQVKNMLQKKRNRMKTYVRSSIFSDDA